MSVVKHGGNLVLLAAVIAALLLFGCVTVPRFELAESMELPGTGYTIEYPSGWHADVMEPLGWAVMSQFEVEMTNGMITAGGSMTGGGTFSTGYGETEGYEVWFQRMSRANATTLSGAPIDPSERAALATS